MTPVDFLAALESLCRERPVGRELDGWYERAQVLIDAYKTRRDWTFEFSHWMWHFLGDADIRAKDAEYADRQFADLEVELAELRSAICLPKTGHY